MKKLAILLIVEKGLLESQAKLLIESIRQYVKEDGKKVDIFSFSPRKERKPSQQTLNTFKQYSVIHNNNDLNCDFDYFPLANGLYAATYFEKTFPFYDHILLTDTDTVFMNDIPNELLEKQSVFVSPADNKGVGSFGPEDSEDEFWHKMYAHFGITVPNEYIRTTVRQELIRPYHNSGFVLANGTPNFFSQWLNDFKSLMQSKIRPSFIGRDGTNFGFFEQLVLSITTQRESVNKKYFPKMVNYPIPFKPIMQKRANHPNFSELVHIHYHKWFQHPGFLDHVTTDEDKQSEQYQWLKSRLPLQPIIDGPFKC